MYVETISLSKFLSRYAKVKGVDLNHLKHDDVKVLFPYLKRATFDEVKSNKELVFSGKILLVSDGKKTIPYYVPQLDIEEEMEYTELKREDVTRFNIDDNHYDYSQLSEYELRQLLRRKFSSARNQKEARRELESRGVELKKSNKRKNYN